jgi:uncharacterized protein RhaS with RHS repeats
VRQTETYYRARYYDPTRGRFVSEDPLERSAGANLYAYTDSNPASRVDPLGLWWEYSQRSGQLVYVNNQTGQRTTAGVGYAGYGQGLNNPQEQYTPDVGPIPVGAYTIGPQQTNVTGAGVRLPGSMRLTPRGDTITGGRSGFLIHNGSFTNMSSSRGCIVLPPSIRNQIGGSGDTELWVLP